MIILQESCIDALGASLIYTPMEYPSVKSFIKGQDNVEIQMMPSGLVISSDHGRVLDGGIGFGASSSSSSASTSRASRTSLLTVVLQILVPSDNALEAAKNMHTHVNAFIETIKKAKCSNALVV